MLEENKKKQSIIKKIDYILIAFQIIIAVALGVKLFTMGVVPIIYLILELFFRLKRAFLQLFLQ